MIRPQPTDDVWRSMQNLDLTNLQMTRRYFTFTAVGFWVACATSGCGPAEQGVIEKRPRPVIVDTLTKQLPPNASLVSASVGSWKTESIGFEVGGRIASVVEPNTEIEGRVQDGEGNLIVVGTPIGKLESERYRLLVAKAEADVTRAEQSFIGAETDLIESLPAQVTAAEATRDLAKTEYDRSQRLFDQKAGAEGDVDRDKANFKNAVSQLKQLAAAKNAKIAEIESLRNGVLQAKQNLRDAERNRDDCTLYSSFRGQIAEVSVVPGSFVAAGQAVATIQMMDPIKVELEVSAEDSRRLRNSENLPVAVTQPDGTIETHDGYLYLIDPLADPLTRTFTITLLVMNKKLSNRSHPDLARTDQIWRLDFKFLPGAEDGMLFAAEKALREDKEGHFLWMAENLNVGASPPRDGLLKVRKLRVERGGRKIPFLGNWIFQQVVINDSKFDPTKNVVIGKLSVNEGEAEDWNGDTVLLDAGEHWMLRPGDLVKVDMSGEVAVNGYFVPMDAIVRKQEKSYLFVVEDADADGKMHAKRKPIRIVEDIPSRTTSRFRRIESMDGTSLDGQQYVTAGAHYLIDGEVVSARSAEVTR